MDKISNLVNGFARQVLQASTTKQHHGYHVVAIFPNGMFCAVSENLHNQMQPQIEWPRMYSILKQNEEFVLNVRLLEGLLYLPAELRQIISTSNSSIAIKFCNGVTLGVDLVTKTFQMRGRSAKNLIDVLGSILDVNSADFDIVEVPQQVCLYSAQPKKSN